MRIAVDTSVLVRVVMRDDPLQARKAAKLLLDAELIAVAIPCLCEFVWVLRKLYGLQAAEASAAIRALIAAHNIEVNRPAVEAGLSMLDAGGDFADGAITYEGKWLGAESFVSFDRTAVALLKAQGQPTRML
jgi:predicted nucleic-acid-binding protein